MQQSPLMLWRFVLMLIRIRKSKDLLEQFQELEVRVQIELVAKYDTNDA